MRESGGMVMAQANQNLNKAAGDDMVDWKMFNKKSQFNIQITDKYNHFTPSRGTESYTLMPFASGDVEKNVMTKPSGTHSNGIGAKLAYIYNGKTSKLQIAASLRNNHSANSTLQEQTISRIGTIDTKDFRHNDNISPTLKVYYKKNFSKKTSLEATMDAIYNHTKQWRDYEAIDTYLSHTKEDYYLMRPKINVTHKPNNRINLFAYVTYATRRKGLNSAGGTTTRPQQLTLSVRYATGSWSFNLYSKNPLMKTSEKNEIHRNGYTNISDSYSPRTNYNMFAMRVSYRFVYGKKHKYQNVDIDDENRSAILDAGTK